MLSFVDRNARVLELGGGMTGFAGLALAASSSKRSCDSEGSSESTSDLKDLCVSEVVITDGNADTVQRTFV